jgi:hypothetical protein
MAGRQKTFEPQMNADKTKTLFHAFLSAFIRVHLRLKISHITAGRHDIMAAEFAHWPYRFHWEASACS